MRLARAALLALAAMILAGCRANQATPGDAPPTVAGPNAVCATCHADEASRFARSSHALAARVPGAAGTPGVAADLTAPLLLADATGAESPHVAQFVIGGRRREDVLVLREGRLHAAPRSWSVVRSLWVDPSVEAATDAGLPEGAPPWYDPRRAHDEACSRCHPVAAAPEAPGLTCATCHAAGADHGRSPGPTRSEPTAIPTTAVDALSGCGPCHATGTALARHALPRGIGRLALTDVLLPATSATPLGQDRSFRPDGRPADAHGMEALALRQSACFLRGRATCVTCHDPHGGATGRTSLREGDPDDSCRTCHAEVAADAAGHARHAVHAGPVPLAADEPSGPTATRLPGCVDCHAPAVLPFGRDGRARDHAIGVPVPEVASGPGILDACTACHEGWTREQFAPALPPAEEAPSGRRTWDRALRAGLAREAAAPGLLAAVVADAAAPADVRTSAANLLPGGFAAGSASQRALESAIAATMDPAAPTEPGLVRALLLAAARGTVAGAPLAARVLASPLAEDWRIKLASASALDQAGSPEGLPVLESLRTTRGDEPREARGEVAFELGMAYLRRGAPSRAVALLAEAADVLPDRPAVLLGLGAAHAGAGNADAARRAWEAVLALSPGDPYALRNLEALAAATAP